MLIYTVTDPSTRVKSMQFKIYHHSRVVIYLFIVFVLENELRSLLRKRPAGGLPTVEKWLQLIPPAAGAR